jgi:hypothetical protein
LQVLGSGAVIKGSDGVTVLGLNVTVTVAAVGTPYVDPGATATDNVDGVVTSRIVAQVSHTCCDKNKLYL